MEDDLKQLTKAAEQGGAYSQTALGFMYQEGQGVGRGYVRAHMWFNLAASSGHKRAAGYRDKIAKKMTPDQIAEAQELATKFQSKNSL